MLGFIRRSLDARRFRKEREIYHFFDGRNHRSIDPWRAYRQFLSHPDFEAATSAEALEGKEPECSKSVEVICECFGLQSYDGRTNTGMTDAEVFDFFNGITDYIQQVKKKRQFGANSQSVMDTQLWESVADQNSITNSHSDSGSTFPVPESVEQ